MEPQIALQKSAPDSLPKTDLPHKANNAQVKGLDVRGSNFTYFLANVESIFFGTELDPTLRSATHLSGEKVSVHAQETPKYHRMLPFLPAGSEHTYKSCTSVLS